MLFRYSKSYIKTSDGVSYLRLDEKDYYSTGYAYGHLLVQSKNPILKILKKTSSKIGMSLLYRLTKKHYKKVIIPQRYLDEIRGYSDATGISYEHLFCLNFSYDVIKRWGLHCSTIVFYNKDSVIVGRNTDLTSWIAKIAVKHAKSIVVDVSIPKKNRFTHVCPPLLIGAITGLNDKGILVSSHQIVPTVEKPYGPRLATSLLMRIALEESNNIKKAESIAKNNITTRSVNLMVASEKERRSVTCEIHPNKAVIINNDGNSCCTTHFQSDEMHKLHAHPKKTSKLRLNSSTVRLKSMYKLIDKKREVSYSDMIKILKDHSNGLEFKNGAKSLTNVGTYQSFVFDMTKQLLWVSNSSKLPVSLTGKYIKLNVNNGK